MASPTVRSNGLPPTLRNRRDWNNTINSYSTFTRHGRPPWQPGVPQSLQRKSVVPIKNNPAGARDLSSAFSEHTWDIEHIAHRYRRSNINKINPRESKGLPTAKAQEYLEKYGKNELPKPKEISMLRLFFKQFANLLWIMLLIVDALSLIAFIADPTQMSQLWVTIIIFVVIFTMCCISFKHEREAVKVVQGFQGLLPENSLVIRDGREQTIPATDIVCGDVVIIKNGTRVPADIRIIWCSQLKLETSSITGESEPNEYQSEPVEESVTIFESHNVAFDGSLCVDGEGVGIVIRTGTSTVIGQIADMTTGQPVNKSRIEVQLVRFVIFLIFAATAIGIVVFIIGGFVHRWKNLINLLCAAFLVCGIGMVPTGMPATVTSMIALVARRLAENNVFLKRLDIVEALGSVNIIASDKTGTLTKNVMTVTDIWFHDEAIAGKPKTSEAGEKTTLESFESPIKDLLEIMSVCNASKFVEYEEKTALEIEPSEKAPGKFDKPEVLKPATGSPSEISMIRYCDDMIDINGARKSHDIVFEIPFNSKRKWHLMIAKEKALENGEAQYKLLIKGASEILVEHCKEILTKNGKIPFDSKAKDKFQDAYNNFGSKGRRVIGFFYKTFTAKDGISFDLEAGNFTIDDLVFAGICAIMDPPRDETHIAIENCRNAGIKVFMVTGDHALTAAAIAREIKLIQDVPDQPRDYEVLQGEEISHLSEDQWNDLLKKNALVFARTTPEQKLLIVEQCQKRKQIIAMTGDGVNDAPALKRADIGIAMGSGSDVAKQAADVILMDDNFSSIVHGVQEGRLMVENIKKLLSYIAAHCVPELWAFLVNFCFGMPLGMTSLQILSIDLGTEIPPGIAMAKEPMEGDLMNRVPRAREKAMVSNALIFFAYIYGPMIETLGCILAYLYIFWSHGIYLPDLWMSSVEHWSVNSPDFVSNNHNFTWQDQIQMQKEACAAWQMAIVFGQCFVMLIVRTRRQSIFKHGLFSNMHAVCAQIITVILVCIMIYVPYINDFFGGAPIPAMCWVIAGAVGCFNVAINEVRKYFIRHAPQHPLVRPFKW
jgi:sodium/potassium-transporting ATPase subunit alpha